MVMHCHGILHARKAMCKELGLASPDKQGGAGGAADEEHQRDGHQDVGRGALGRCCVPADNLGDVFGQRPHVAQQGALRDDPCGACEPSVSLSARERAMHHPAQHSPKKDATAKGQKCILVAAMVMLSRL